MTREQAQALLKVPFTSLIRDVEFPALRSGMGDRDREEFLQRQLLLEDGSRGRNAGRGEAQAILLLMFAITGFVLAIACANVANLLLARVADRTTEISVRLSIGASTARLLRLLLVEACVLGVLGSVGALVVSRITLNGLVAMMPAKDGATFAFQINTSVLLFTVALGLGTAVLFGLFPALHGVRTGIAAGIHAQSTRTSGSRSAKRFRASLATAQMPSPLRCLRWPACSSSASSTSRALSSASSAKGSSPSGCRHISTATRRNARSRCSNRSRTSCAQSPESSPSPRPRCRSSRATVGTTT